jgi:hypothetical protein
MTGEGSIMQSETFKGQSLVEMAIVTPLLIFLFLGVFEVGYVIRSYMILDNAVREAARFASKPSNTNIDGLTVEEIGYHSVISHTLATMSDQIPVDFEENGVIVISFYDVPAQFPCDPELRGEPIGNDMWPNCDCNLAVLNPYKPIMVDHPGYSSRLTFSKPLSVAGRIDTFDMAERLGREQLKQMCALGKSDEQAALTIHQIVIVEVWYDHYQLFGFPLLSNPFTDPIELYSRAVMRYIKDRE